MAYELKGNPDAADGTCQSVNSWHIDKGTINDVDVGGLTIAGVNQIRGNVFKGNWQVIYFVDDKASDQQQGDIVAVWTGKEGGPVSKGYRAREPRLGFNMDIAGHNAIQDLFSFEA